MKTFFLSNDIPCDPFIPMGRTPCNIKSGGGGGPTKTQKENDKLNNQLLKAQLKNMNKEEPEMPVYTPPPMPKYAPPPSSTSADAEAAAMEARKKAARRRGFARSKLGAGNTGALGSSGSGGSAVAQGSKNKLG